MRIPGNKRSKTIPVITVTRPSIPASGPDCPPVNSGLIAVTANMPSPLLKENTWYWKKFHEKWNPIEVFRPFVKYNRERSTPAIVTVRNMTEALNGGRPRNNIEGICKAAKRTEVKNIAFHLPKILSMQGRI